MTPKTGSGGTDAYRQVIDSRQAGKANWCYGAEKEARWPWQNHHFWRTHTEIAHVALGRILP
jgi:hypothetical protein